jgi:hypothetical protein
MGLSDIARGHIVRAASDPVTVCLDKACAHSRIRDHANQLSCGIAIAPRVRTCVSSKPPCSSSVSSF